MTILAISEEHLVPMFAGFCTNDLATELKVSQSVFFDEKLKRN